MRFGLFVFFVSTLALSTPTAETSKDYKFSKWVPYRSGTHTARTSNSAYRKAQKSVLTYARGLCLRNRYENFQVFRNDPDSHWARESCEVDYEFHDEYGFQRVRKEFAGHVYWGNEIVVVARHAIYFSSCSVHVRCYKKKPPQMEN